MSMAPASTIPWIEFAADMSGVCRVAGTLLMTSIPTSRLSTKMVRSVSSVADMGVALLGVGGRCLVGPGLGLVCPGLGDQGRGAGVDHPAVVGDHHSRLDLVLRVDGEVALA